MNSGAYSKVSVLSSGSNCNLEMLVFVEGGNPRTRREEFSELGREPTNSTHTSRQLRESNPGYIGGRRALQVP